MNITSTFVSTSIFANLCKFADSVRYSSLRHIILNRTLDLQVVEQFSANGGTDIQNALKIGLKLVAGNDQKSHQPIIVFLTDGEPTVGESNTDRIISSVSNSFNSHCNKLNIVLGLCR